MTDHVNFTGAWPHNCGVPPEGDPLLYTLSGLLFPTANVESLVVNLEDEKIRNVINNVQAVYIDNRSNALLTLRVASGPGYRIDAKANTQGWYALPIKTGNLIAIKASAPVTDPTLINVCFSNVLLYGTQSFGDNGVTLTNPIPSGSNNIGTIGNIPANIDALSPIPALAGASAGANGPDQSNANARGIKLFVNVTAITGTGASLTVALQAKDPVSGQYYTALASAAFTATGFYVLTLYPGLAAQANVAANDVLPKTWRVTTTIAGTTPSVSATIGAALIV